jgi:hypothetical protein
MLAAELNFNDDGYQKVNCGIDDNVILILVG